MTGPRPCLYEGEVVHKRLKPVRHELRYRVFSLFLDVDRMAEDCAGLNVLGYNRQALMSIHDRDHGRGIDEPIARQVRELLREHGLAARAARIFMLCYPRVLGYVFNPLTVYYVFDANGLATAMVYEVNNTFGGRHSYVVPAGDAGPLRQNCDKILNVSPFNASAGHYRFHGNWPDQSLALGILLDTPQGPCLKAYFTGTRRDLNDRTLARAFLAVPFLTFKVIAAIHWEALKLRLKGLRVAARAERKKP